MFEVAANELQEGTERSGLMARAFSDANGDESEARAGYLRLRVRQLQEEHERTVEQDRQIKADQKLRADQKAQQAREPPALDGLGKALMFVVLVLIVIGVVSLVVQ